MVVLLCAQSMFAFFCRVLRRIIFSDLRWSYDLYPATSAFRMRIEYLIFKVILQGYSLITTIVQAT